MAVVSLGLMLAIFVFVLAIPILICVYVYRDAKAREMDAVLWCLIAVLAPSLIGLIVYLAVRGSYTNRRCGQCGAVVAADYAVCPACGAALKNRCPQCESPVEASWKNCTRCGAALPPMSELAPEPPRAKFPVWLLVVVIGVPVLLLAVLFVSLIGYNLAGTTREIIMEKEVVAFAESAQSAPQNELWIADPTGLSADYR